MSFKCKKSLFLCFLMAAVAFSVCAENGSRLWLRFAETNVRKTFFQEFVPIRMY